MTMSPATHDCGQDARLLIQDALVSFMQGSPHLGVVVGVWPKNAVSADDAWVFADGTTRWPRASLSDGRTVWQIGVCHKSLHGDDACSRRARRSYQPYRHRRGIRASRQPLAPLHQLAKLESARDESRPWERPSIRHNVYRFSLVAVFETRRKIRLPSYGVCECTDESVMNAAM